MDAKPNMLSSRYGIRRAKMTLGGESDREKRFRLAGSGWGGGYPLFISVDTLAKNDDNLSVEICPRKLRAYDSHTRHTGAWFSRGVGHCFEDDRKERIDLPPIERATKNQQNRLVKTGLKVQSDTFCCGVLS